MNNTPEKKQKTSLDSGIELDSDSGRTKRYDTGYGSNTAAPGSDQFSGHRGDSGVQLQAHTVTRRQTQPMVKHAPEPPRQQPQSLGLASSHTKSAFRFTQKLTSLMTMAFVGVIIYTWYTWGSVINNGNARHYNSIAAMAYGLIMMIHHPIAYRYYVLHVLEYRRIHWLMTLVGAAVAGYGYHLFSNPM